MNPITLVSLGIDIGSTTTHQILSRLTLSQASTGSLRYEVTKREIIKLGRIRDTPLLDENTIDLVRVSKMLMEELREWEISSTEIDTGAVIITGEAARKTNASEVIELISMESGKFISAVAGPNYESILAALGSNVSELAVEQKKEILNVDVGGGTGNLAVVSPKGVRMAACVNLGGRLLRKSGDMFYFTQIGKTLFNELGFSLQSFKDSSLKTQVTMIRDFAYALVHEFMKFLQGKPVVEGFIVTDLPRRITTKSLSITGGIGEVLFSTELENYIKNDPFHFNDMGVFLAKALRDILIQEGYELLEPPNKIRATVIGAGAFTLNVSGNTTYLDSTVKLPLRNKKVIPLYLDKQKITKEYVAREIRSALQTWEQDKDEDEFALYFEDSVYPSYNDLARFVQGLELVFHSRTKPLILVFKEDLANSIGNILKRETKLRLPILFIDEIPLKEGDYLDINYPLDGTLVFPVTVKSLIFNT